MIGEIPFDVDIMNSYGSDEFWFNIKKSLLEPALAKAWNKLSENEQLGSVLESSRRSPIQLYAIEARLSAKSLYQRVLIIYGLIIGVVGIAYGIVGKEILFVVLQDPIRVVSLLIGALGIGIALAAIFGRSLK